MPVTHDIVTRSISRDEYHEIDYRVMGLAFEAHRKLGRMCDEVVYQEVHCQPLVQSIPMT